MKRQPDGVILTCVSGSGLHSVIVE